EKVTVDGCAVATAAIANTARTKDVITLPPPSTSVFHLGLSLRRLYSFHAACAFYPTIKKGRTNLPLHEGTQRKHYFYFEEVLMKRLFRRKPFFYIASPDTTSAPSFRNTSGDVLIFKLRPPPPRMIQSSAIMRSSI